MNTMPNHRCKITAFSPHGQSQQVVIKGEQCRFCGVFLQKPTFLWIFAAITRFVEHNQKTIK
jgi:hypothetical protein